MDTYTQITFGSKEIDLNVDVSSLTKISQPAKERKFVKKTMIPVSQWEINKVHGKHKYLMPRLEWNTSHYDPRKKAFITNWIKKGSRHRTLRKDN